jgi:hypothetical protein
MFWEDMFENVPESKDWVRMGADGKPTPYGAASYGKMGRITRYMARLAHPGWRGYLKKRIDLAIDAGADGISYDNNFNEYLYETYREMLRHATTRKRDFIFCGNLHSNTYVLNRVTNFISTEDGSEPGIYAAANVSSRDIAKGQLVPIGSGYLITNLGAYRVQHAFSRGWKPMVVELGGRETSERFTRPIPARRHQLAMAEAWPFGAAMQLFSEGAFADGLYRARPEAMEIWQAVSRYNRFQAANEALYTNAQPLSNIAVVLDESSAGVATMNALAARNVGFRVLYEHDLTADYLKGSRAVVVASREPRPKASAAIESFAATGGKVFRLSEVTSIDALTRDLLAAAPPPFTLEAPAGVLAVATTQYAGQRLLIHLLNYAPQAAAGVRIQVRGTVKSAALHSPDESRGAMRVDGARIEVPRLDTYSVVVLQLERPVQP